MKINQGVKFYTVRDFMLDLTNDFIYSDAILEAFCYENSKQLNKLIENVNVNNATFKIDSGTISLKKLIETWIDLVIMITDDEVDHFNDKKVKNSDNRVLRRTFEVELMWENLSKICEIEYDIEKNSEYKMEDFISLLIKKLKTTNNMLLLAITLNDT